MMWVLFLTSALIIGTSQHLDAKTSDLKAAVPFKGEIADGKGKDWSVITLELRPGAVDSWHSRPGGEFVYVLEGAGRLEVGGKPAITLNPGTVATLTSTPHHVLKNTSRTRALKVLVVFLAENRQPHPLLDRTTQGPQGTRAQISNGESRQRNAQEPHKSADMGLIF
jgi:quercetin dioxygenase-like cupin family protein